MLREEKGQNSKSWKHFHVYRLKGQCWQQTSTSSTIPRRDGLAADGPSYAHSIVEVPIVCHPYFDLLAQKNLKEVKRLRRENGEYMDQPKERLLSRRKAHRSGAFILGDFKQLVPKKAVSTAAQDKNEANRSSKEENKYKNDKERWIVNFRCKAAKESKGEKDIFENEW